MTQHPTVATTTIEPTIGFGIDIGGSGVKGAPVDLRTGTFTAERMRIKTPQPSTPEAVAEVVKEILDHFSWDGPYGVTVPAVVQHGVARTAANIDKAWIDTDVDALFEKHTGRNSYVVNDADAAGLAEVRFGATLGTGIGSALVHEGVLIPNSELGHLEVDGHDAETRAASSVKENEGLSYKQWAHRLNKYYAALEAVLWPDLFVVGGGVSKDAAKFIPLLDIRSKIVPAMLMNNAGIVGAAVLSTERSEDS
jgi:polyphosphate glucokinase